MEAVVSTVAGLTPGRDPVLRVQKVPLESKLTLSTMIMQFFFLPPSVWSRDLSLQT